MKYYRKDDEQALITHDDAKKIPLIERGILFKNV